MFYDGDEIQKVASFKTEVVDTVGAGDSHIGAVIAGLSKGMEVKAAVRLAKPCGSSGRRYIRTGYGLRGISKDFGGMGK